MNEKTISRHLRKQNALVKSTSAQIARDMMSRERQRSSGNRFVKYEVKKKHFWWEVVER